MEWVESGWSSGTSSSSPFFLCVVAWWCLTRHRLRLPSTLETFIKCVQASCLQGARWQWSFTRRRRKVCVCVKETTQRAWRHRETKAKPPPLLPHLCGHTSFNGSVWASERSIILPHDTHRTRRQSEWVVFLLYGGRPDATTIILCAVRNGYVVVSPPLRVPPSPLSRSQSTP